MKLGEFGLGEVDISVCGCLSVSCSGLVRERGFGRLLFFTSGCGGVVWNPQTVSLALPFNVIYFLRGLVFGRINLIQLKDWLLRGLSFSGFVRIPS